MIAPICYRDLIKDFLLSFPQREGSSMSLRRLALEAEVSASYLSQVLNHKKQLTEDRAIQIAASLRLKAKERSLLTNLVRFEHCRSEAAKREILAQIQVSDEIQIKHVQRYEMKVLSKWYYAVILEYADVTELRLDPKRLSRAVGISALEAELALDLLLRLGLLERRGDRLVKSAKHFSVKEIPSEVIRGFHAQCLDRAQKSLKTDESSKRDFTASTIAIDRDLLPEVKKRIRAFRYELMQFAQASSADSVFQLCVQFFPVVLDHNEVLQKES